MTRRQLLTALLAAGITPASLLRATPALAFGDAALVNITEIALEGTISRPNAWIRLLYEVVHTTSVECDTTPAHLSINDPELFEHPFAVVLGSGRFEQPNEAGLEQLSRYLSYGGFLLFDDTSGAAQSGFDDAVRTLCASLFPTRPLSPIPADHSVFRSFFLLDRPLGRVDRFPYLEAVTTGNVSPILYSRNDLSGALERGSDGRSVYAVVPGGERQRREAVKLGINLILYALTANYKKDQVHVRRLLMQGRIE